MFCLTVLIQHREYVTGLTCGDCGSMNEWRGKIGLIGKRLKDYNVYVHYSIQYIKFLVVCTIHHEISDSLEQGCQTQVHSGPKLSSEVKSRARLNMY